jgi:hypothetical protein
MVVSYFKNYIAKNEGRSDMDISDPIAIMGKIKSHNS